MAEDPRQTRHRPRGGVVPMDSHDNEISVAEHTARALWLVNLPLLDERTKDADWRTALRIRLPGLAGMDEAVCQRIVERLFRERLTLLANVDAIARDLFELRHGLPRFKADGRLRHLTRMVDPDALACLDGRLELAWDDRLDWAAIAVGDGWKVGGLLRDGSVDTHIHLGGVLPPLYYWVAIMGGQVPLEQVKLSPTNQKKTKAALGEWRRAIIDALFLRLRLAASVQRYFCGKGRKVFAHLPGIPDPASPCPRGRAGLGFGLRWEDLPEESPAKTWAVVRDLAVNLSRPQRWDRQAGERGSLLADPLRFDFGSSAEACHYAEGERRLLVNAARLLREAAEPSLCDRIEADLLAYLRIRNAFHQKLVHDHGVDGLLSFMDSFGRRGFLFAKKTGRRERADGSSRRCGGRRVRLRRLVRQLEQSRMAVALDEQLRHAFDDPEPAAGQACFLPVRRIEMRVSPPSDSQLLHTLRAWLGGIAQHVGGQQAGFRNSQVGLVFHFIKSRSLDPDRCRLKAEIQARRLCNLLGSYPGLRRYIVGIDAAGNERDAVPRQFGGAYRQLRRCQERLRPAPKSAQLHLGWTFHAGEDADDLLTALRHIDEVVRLLLPESKGGRLGHALLLGEPPSVFYRGPRREVEVTLGPHLLDLVWAQGKLAGESRPAHVPWLRSRLADLLGMGSGEPNVDRCYREMWLGDEGGQPQQEVALLKILGFQGDASKPLTLRVDERWCGMVAELQALLREELARRPIAVEANPSSNLIIGGYSRFSDLPYRILVEAGLPLSINTDDPGLFMSSLPGEFSALYDALSEVGMSHREILRWLQDRMDDASHSTFLGPQVPVGADHPILQAAGMNETMRFAPPFP